MDTLLPSALPRSLGGAGGTPLTFGRPSISAAVLQRDDGRNRLRALPCEKSSWQPKPQHELFAGVVMDMVIEGTCVACAIDTPGYVQQKKHSLLKRVLFPF